MSGHDDSRAEVGTDAASDVALTERTELHGCSCKVSQGDLHDLLEAAALTDPQGELLFGVGEDAAARRLTDELALVSTVDYFTPIVDDPYDFGWIAACNAASDAFATGATANLGCLVVLGMPRDLTGTAVDVLAGIRDAIDSMDGVVTGGHTITNPWPFAGGAVSATAAPDDLLTSAGAQAGDRLYLTKPLGVQAAMGAVRAGDGEFGDTVTEATDRPIADIGADAIAWMRIPNRAAAIAARDFATAATDVTGFGVVGQAGVLAETSEVGIELTDLPVIAGTPSLSDLFGYGLRQGQSAETSGGLLLSVPEAAAGDLADALAAADVFHREIGRVTSGSGVSLVDPSIEPVTRG